MTDERTADLRELYTTIISQQVAEIAQLKERVKELEYEVQCAHEDMAGENI